MTVSNDGFSDTADAAHASNRPTMPSLGGVRRPGLGEQAAALAGARQAPDVDDRKSASLARALAESFVRHVKLSGSGTAPAAGALVITVGGPKPGFVWHVRRVNVGPIDYSAGAGAFPTGVTVIAVVGPSETSSVLVDDAQHVASLTTSYPAEGTWGRGELTLQHGDSLRIVVVGLAQDVAVSVGGQADETAAQVPEIYGL